MVDGETLLRLAGDLSRAEKQYRECLPLQMPRAREILEECWERVRNLIGGAVPVADKPEAATPMVLHCPECRTRHIDVGEFATKPHHTHACQSCGMVWRPAIGPTVGVQFLPGFKNEIRTPTKINVNEEGDRCGTCDGTHRHAHAYDAKGEIPSMYDQWLPENLMTDKEIQP